MNYTINTNIEVTREEVEFYMALERDHPNGKWTNADKLFIMRWNSIIQHLLKTGRVERLDNNTEPTYLCQGLTADGEYVKSAVLRGESRVVVVG